MSEPKFTIELRPHVGVRVIAGEQIEFAHPQKIVLAGVNGRQPKQVGYYPTHEGGVFLPLSSVRERMGEWLYAQMVEAIDAAMAAAR